MGFWHGANWTFLIWGIYHAILISIYRLIEPSTRKFSYQFRSIGGILITLPLIMLSWIPFRANSLSDAISMWIKVVNPYAYTEIGMRENVYIIAFLVLISFFLVYLVKVKILPILNSLIFIITMLDIILIMIITSLVIIFFKETNQFIYFQF